MRIGIAVWENRIASVGDAAPQIEIWDLGEDKLEFIKKKEFHSQATEWERVVFLQKEGVKLFICGALSRRMEALLYEEGIEVEGWIGGLKEDVLQELCREDSDLNKFRLHCCRRSKRRLRRRRHGK